MLLLEHMVQCPFLKVATDSLLVSKHTNLGGDQMIISPQRVHVLYSMVLLLFFVFSNTVYFILQSVR